MDATEVRCQRAYSHKTVAAQKKPLGTSSQTYAARKRSHTEASTKHYHTNAAIKSIYYTVAKKAKLYISSRETQAVKSATNMQPHQSIREIHPPNNSHETQNFAWKIFKTLRELAIANFTYFSCFPAQQAQPQIMCRAIQQDASKQTAAPGGSPFFPSIVPSNGKPNTLPNCLGYFLSHAYWLAQQQRPP